MSSEIATTLRERAERRSSRAVRRRVAAILLLGPLTTLGGLAWAIVQPYRIVFLHSEGKGVYDYVVQPPLLAALVGIVFMVVIAPGLVEDLEGEAEGDGPAT
ncbi:hypothetical protein BH09ACT13_BH09ACT13_05960 [soil metagenome]